MTTLISILYPGPETWPTSPAAKWEPVPPVAPYFLRCVSKMGTSSTWVNLKSRLSIPPDHSTKHISFLVEKRGEPMAIYTGGSLMMGGAARVHLLGARVASFLARWLHQAIHGKLPKLPNDVNVYPSHGVGSYCSASSPACDSDYSTIA